MGWHIEVNTLLRLGNNDPTASQLSVGKTFTTTKSNIRLYLIDIPILILAEDWTVLGYCAIRKNEMVGSKIKIDVEIISIFTDVESEIHTSRLKDALKSTGYLK